MSRIFIAPKDVASADGAPVVVQLYCGISTRLNNFPMPLVSVIVNVRNGSAYLREALDCVMAQTFADWEIIAWDDCSTDDSARIVAAYKDPRIRYFLSPKETPLGQARANALRQARGEWLAFLDQDDLWTATKLEKQMALADESAGIIYGRTVLFWSSGQKREYDQAHEFQPLPEGDIFSELFRSACFIAMSSAVLRRSAVEAAGSIPEWVEMTPDYYLYVAIARRYPARAVQEVVCWYRMHGNNMWPESRRKVHQEALRMIHQWTGYLDPRLAAYRRRTHATALALDEMGSAASIGTGIRRLFLEGSVTWLASRPFVHAFRRIRRKVYRPLWQKGSPQPPSS